MKAQTVELCTVSEKKEILQSFIRKFESELAALLVSAKSAHEAATHEENQSEDKHDTRGVEASYLAGAQGARAAELRQVILEYRALLDSQTKPHERAAAGAVVCMQPLDEEGGDAKGPPMRVLIAVRGGGTTIEWGGKTLSVLTPSSPLGESTLGTLPGEEVSVDSKAGSRWYRIEAIS
jgi:transcription elongation GreA/GreB family factor